MVGVPTKILNYNDFQSIREKEVEILDKIIDIELIEPSIVNFGVN